MNRSSLAHSHFLLAILTPDSLSLKSEPNSPAGSSHATSPSPSCSDGQSTMSNPPLSPPYSPSTMASEAPNHSTPPPVQMIINPSSIVALPDLANVKIPIPKVVKPAAPAPSVRQPQQPLLLTSSQLAQLTQSGIIKVGAAPGGVQTANTLPVSTTVNTMQAMSPATDAKSIIIKTEPGNPLTTALPTVQTMPMAQNHTQDVDVRSKNRLSCENMQVYFRFFYR